MQYLVKNEYDNKAKVIFNAHTGMKIRMAVDGFDYVKSIGPELVDIAITKFCNYGCKNCYQSSTKDGKHGELNYIYNMLDILSDLQTFEVALGGGEPVHHPFFINILEYCDFSNIVPNFTTFGTDWLDDQDILDAVKKNVGGIGVSVYSKQSLDKYHKIKDAIKCSDKTVASVQHIVGMFPFKTTYDLVKSVDRILLLGYKSVGFGKNKIPNKYTDDQIKMLFEDEGKIISVDTAFLDTYGHVLDELGISQILRSSPEGKFSCYIDAVDKTIGASSYVEKDEMVPFELKTILGATGRLDMDSFKGIYKTF